MRAGVVLLAGLLLATACRRETAVPTVSGSATVVTSEFAPVGEYKVSNEGAQSITVGDLVIETAADLPTRTVSHDTTVGGDNAFVVTLRGWVVVVHEGRLLVAGRDFGPAPGGSRIRLAKDGVHVGGELRGPLP